jgi:hypothetical protein
MEEQKGMLVFFALGVIAIPVASKGITYLIPLSRSELADYSVAVFRLCLRANTLTNVHFSSVRFRNEILDILRLGSVQAKNFP